MSEILKIQGELHGTCGFQDPDPTPRGGLSELPETEAVNWLKPKIPPFRTSERIVRAVTTSRARLVIIVSSRGQIEGNSVGTSIYPTGLRRGRPPAQGFLLYPLVDLRIYGIAVDCYISTAKSLFDSTLAMAAESCRRPNVHQVLAFFSHSSRVSTA